MSRFRQFLYVLSCFFFPERCIFCNKTIEPLQLSCSECRTAISKVKPPLCPFCGSHKEDCKCQKKRHAYDRVIAPFYYEGAVREGVLRLKKWDDPQAVSFFALQMAAAVRRELPDLPFDAVCFTPMIQKDLRKREYNQSELVAKKMAQVLQLPFCDALEKTYETKPQKGLDRAARSGNVLGVFDVKEPFSAHSVLLVDDVVTTGATAHECAKMLKLYGAETVTVSTIAITPPPQKETSAVDA